MIHHHPRHTTTMGACLFLLLLIFLCNLVESKPGQGYDLAPDEKMRVGVKYRPDHCPLKTKQGDYLTMRFTGWRYKDGKKFDSTDDQ
mmetsp:Transcript_26571/g.40790  ORF Transcript_26571/g.40790 Transcript_26571/m.40790 type:complete len:87 (+) Transcript_26571:14-274(+)